MPSTNDLLVAAISLDASMSVAAYVALIPVVAVFVANWFISGTSAYFRIHPSICISPTPRLVMYASTAAVVILMVAFVGIASGSLGIPLVVLCIISLLMSVYLIKRQLDEISFVERVLIGILMVLDCVSIPMWIYNHLAVFTHQLYTLGNILFSIEEVIFLIVELSLFFFFIGIFESAMRRIFLYIPEENELILQVFSESRCVIAAIDYIENEDNPNAAKCFLKQGYTYENILNPERVLVWRRFKRVYPYRGNFNETHIKGKSEDVSHKQDSEGECDPCNIVGGAKC